MGENWLIRVLRDPVTPGYMALLFVVGVCLRYGSNIMASLNERFRDRAKVTGDEWTRLREENKWLSAECAALRIKVSECEEDRLSWMGRAVKAEAIIQGQGQIRQAAEVAAAEVRLNAIDKEKKAKNPKE